MAEAAEIVGAGQRTGPNQLDCHQAIELLLTRPIDNSHATTGDLLDKLIFTQVAWEPTRRTRRRRSGRRRWRLRNSCTLGPRPFRSRAFWNRHGWERRNARDRKRVGVGRCQTERAQAFHLNWRVRRLRRWDAVGIRGFAWHGRIDSAEGPVKNWRSLVRPMQLGAAVMVSGRSRHEESLCPSLCLQSAGCRTKVTLIRVGRKRGGSIGRSQTARSFRWNVPPSSEPDHETMKLVLEVVGGKDVTELTDRLQVALGVRLPYRNVSLLNSSITEGNNKKKRLEPT